MKIAKIVFMGTPEFAISSLEALTRSKHKIEAVITQPDRPKGRHLHLTPPPVKEKAQAEGLVVLQPENLDSREFKNKIVEICPDVVVVVAYGKILPSWLLSLPKYGCINVHPSLLPKYRGAAPIERAIMEGAKKTGVTIQLMDEGLDTGDILIQEEISVSSAENRGTLEEKLARLGAELLLKAIDGLMKGRITPKRQTGVPSFAPKIEKAETEINWESKAEEISNLVRALNPHPGAYTYCQGRRLKIWEVSRCLSPTGLEQSDIKPGTIVGFDKEAPLVATSDEVLLLSRVQPEGRGKMSGAAYSRGYRLVVGEKLGKP